MGRTRKTLSVLSVTILAMAWSCEPATSAGRGGPIASALNGEIQRCAGPAGTCMGGGSPAVQPVPVTPTAPTYTGGMFGPGPQP